MDRNRTLTITLAACKILKVFLFVIFGISAFIFIHWHINSDYYEHMQIGDLGKNTTSISTEKISFTFADYNASKINSDDRTGATVAKFNLFSFYLLYLQEFSYILLSFFVIKEIQKIIRSVHEFDSFRIRNVNCFRKIGLYCFLFFLTASFHFAQTPDGVFYGLYFHYLPLCFMLASYVLAEVFREGNKLYEEQQLTV